MFGSENSRRNALAMSIGWWYLRRMIRKRGTAAVAGFVAGEGLSFARPHKRHLLRWLVLIVILAGGGFWWWRRQQGGGGDDWGDWTPVVPDLPPTAEPDPTPETPPAKPVPEPVAT